MRALALCVLAETFLLLGRVRQRRGELALLMHAHHNVAPADKLAVDEYLWNRRPLRVCLDTVTNVGIRQHVTTAVLRAIVVQKPVYNAMV